LPPKQWEPKGAQSSRTDSQPSPEANVDQISTGTIRKVPIAPRVEPENFADQEIRPTKAAAAEEGASTGISLVPKPVRKPNKIKKTAKIAIAKAKTRKPSARCSNRIWRC
jgi:hypothetical protein